MLLIICGQYNPAMLTTFARALREWRRKVRLEAALSYRESDRRVPGEEYTWTRHRDMDTAEGLRCDRREQEPRRGDHAEEEERHDRA